MTRSAYDSSRSGFNKSRRAYPSAPDGTSKKRPAKKTLNVNVVRFDRVFSFRGVERSDEFIAQAAEGAAYRACKEGGVFKPKADEMCAADVVPVRAPHDRESPAHLAAVEE